MTDYPLSASQIKTGAQCPMRYKLRYLTDAEETKGSHYLTLGNRVHEAIEGFLTDENRPPFEFGEVVEATLLNRYEELEEYELPDDLYSDGIKCCKEAAGYLTKQNPEIRDVELKRRYWIDREDITSEVTAIIDVATEDEIWDWKTGRIRDETEHEERIQGSVYMAAYNELYGEPPEAIRFLYIKEGKRRSIEPSDENWEYMLKHAKNLQRMKERDDFPAKVGDHCYFCGYEYVCPASPVSYEGVDPDEL